MRPLEVLLAVLNCVALLLLLLPRTRMKRTTQFLPFAAVLTAVGQYLWEGARWQLVPAYVVAVALLSYSMFAMRRYDSAEHRAPPWVRTAFAAVGVGALIFAIVLPSAVPVFGFPPPTGPYAIGTVTYHMVDQARAEIFTANPSDHRELMVQVWYPASASATAKRAPYLQDGKIIAPLAKLLRMPGFVFTHLRLVATNAVSSAPVAVGAPNYPVLIFSPGRGGFRQHNTFQVEELVSHGYIVVAIDHPYAEAGMDFPDGRRVPLDPRMLNRRFIR